jgi:imidazolonepropionase-like amidohydrolase
MSDSSEITLIWVQLEKRILGWPDITDKETADQYVAKNKAMGARYVLRSSKSCEIAHFKLSSFIKLMQEDGCTLSLPFPTRPIPTPRLEVQKAVVDAAHHNDMLAVAHALTNDSVLKMLNAGVDGITHSSLEPVNESVINTFKDTDAFIIPTFAVHASSSGEEKHTRERLAADIADTREKDHFLGCLHIMHTGFSIQNAYDQIASLKEAGVDILW